MNRSNMSSMPKRAWLASLDRSAKMLECNGWNLCSLAITVTNLVRQLAEVQPGGIDSIFSWDQPASSWEVVLPGQRLSAGAVLWIRSQINTSVAIIGTYEPLFKNTFNTDGDFLSGTGLEAWDLSGALANLPNARALTYDAASSSWSWRPAPLERELSRPAFLPPGAAVFLQADSFGQLAMPAPALRISYYHQDHLGSSSVVTDGAGELVEETAFYPFGHARHAFQPRQRNDPYQFTQKEQDRESGLHYFETRFLASALCRFITPDFKYAELDRLASDEFASFAARPQDLNLYAYVRNNPVRFVDPTGMDAKESKPAPKALVVYTADMFADAKKRMGFTDEASYQAALRATYRQEAGSKAIISVQRVNNVKQLGKLLKGSYQTVVINSHAYLNKKALIIGNDDLTPDDLEAMTDHGKKAPKKFFFYGCNSAKTGFAGDVAGRLPKSEITGSTSELRQSFTYDEKTKVRSIQEDRRYNTTYKQGGAVEIDSRKVDLKNTPAISREDFR
jgi:RHS repeat-associated protein